MKRSTLVSAVCALAVVLAFTSTAQAAVCHQYDVVGTTNVTPVEPPTDPPTYNVEILPDEWVTFEPSNPDRPWYEDDTYACYNAHIYANYYEYFGACDFDSSGVVELEEVMEIYEFLGSAPGVVPCPADNPGGTADVELVSFGGAGYNTIKHDDSTGYFSAPHWSYGVAEPVAYVRGSTPSVSVNIRAESASMLTGNPVMIFGDGPGNLDIPATWADVSADVASLTSAPIAGTLPNAVDYFERFEITWRLSIDGGSSWIEAGTTGNTLYVLHANPLSTIYETTVDFGCRYAKSSTTYDDIVEAIWQEFSGRYVYMKSTGQLLTYYPEGSDPGNMPATTAAVLANAYGNCVGYGRFFISIAEGLGVPGVQYTDIWPLELQGNDRPTLLAKNWDWSAYYADPENGWPAHAAGIPGMGNLDPGSKLFVNHVLVRYNGKILDTSYGERFDTLLEWQNTILDGVYYPFREYAGGPAVDWVFDVNPNDGTWPLLVEYR